MKLFITSNTQFGYKGITKDQFSYFTSKIIPFLKKNSKSGDIFIHGGNIFNNKKSTNLDTINNVMDIFEDISKILPIYIIKSSNDELATLLLKRISNVNIIDTKETIKNTLMMSYKEDINDTNSEEIIVFNNDYMENPELYKNILNNSKVCICTHYGDKEIQDDNIINVGSPYQLNKSDNKKGFLVIDTLKKKFKLIENKFSPEFVNFQINEIEDLESIKFKKKDFIDIKVNESILGKKENLNKLNMAINKYNFNNVTYIKDEEETPNIIIDSHTFDIKEIINKFLEKEKTNLSEELETVYKIYEDKF